MITATAARFSDIHYAQLPFTYSGITAAKVIDEYKENAVHATKHYIKTDSFGQEVFAICVNKIDLARLVGEGKIIEAYHSGDLLF